MSIADNLAEEVGGGGRSSLSPRPFGRQRIALGRIPVHLTDSLRVC